MKHDFLIALLVSFFTAQALASTSSSESSDSIRNVDSEIQPPCLQCPPPAKVHKNCGKKKTLYLTESTCYTCPKYKCVKKKYLKEGGGKICPKNLPTCTGRCNSDQTCLVTAQTRYSCSQAKCISRLLNRNRLEDYVISKKK